MSKAELDAARAQMGEESYAQEYECSFEAAIRGAYYVEELRRATEQKRICRIGIDRAVPVHTAWDLGVSDSTAIWFIQCVGRERRLVDYYETSGVGLDHYARVLDDKKTQHGWIYGDALFPARHCSARAVQRDVPHRNAARVGNRAHCRGAARRDGRHQRGAANAGPDVDRRGKMYPGA